MTVKCNLTLLSDPFAMAAEELKDIFRWLKQEDENVALCAWEYTDHIYPIMEEDQFPSGLTIKNTPINYMQIKKADNADRAY